MTIAPVRRYAVIIIAAELLAGCGALQLTTMVSPSGAAPFAFRHHMTFRYTGKEQTFKVPSGVMRIQVNAVGGSGRGSVIADGGRVSAVIPVMPSETLAIYVGGSGSDGGFNGGGGGGIYDASMCVCGGGGGGGGSSYAESTASNAHMWRGWKKATGDGAVVISW